MEKKDDIEMAGGAQENTRRFPYEFEIPENLLIGENQIPRDRQEKLYATIIPNGDLIIRFCGFKIYNVPSFTPFARAFYEYLERAGNLPQELAALRTHPAIQKIINDVREARNLDALFTPSNNGTITGGTH